AQALQAVDNIETVLREAGFELADIVRTTVYVTDVDAFREAGPAVGRRLGEAGASYAPTLIGVARLALLELMVEIEATAVREGATGYEAARARRGRGGAGSRGLGYS